MMLEGPHWQHYDAIILARWCWHDTIGTMMLARWRWHDHIGTIMPAGPLWHDDAGKTTFFTMMLTRQHWHDDASTTTLTQWCCTIILLRTDWHDYVGTMMLARPHWHISHFIVDLNCGQQPHITNTIIIWHVLTRQMITSDLSVLFIQCINYHCSFTQSLFSRLVGIGVFCWNI